MVEENDNTSYNTEDEQGTENIQEMNNIEAEYEEIWGSNRKGLPEIPQAKK